MSPQTRHALHTRREGSQREAAAREVEPGAVELETAEFFRALTPERVERLRGVIRERRLWPGRLLFRAGAPADALWVIQSGQVRLYKSSAKGQVTTLEALGPGEFFGALPASGAATYPASAEALSEGRAWCVPMSTVAHLLEVEPGLGLEMVRVISERLRDAHERLHSFAYDSAAARLARALLRLTAETDPAEPVAVTRRALAEASGTTVETAIRTLRRFQREGMIETRVGEIRILDRDGLRHVAEPS